VPALRERHADVGLLAEAILERLAGRSGAAARLTPDALAALEAYAFPGNVRELENILERGVALASSGVLTADDLMLPAGEAPAEAASGAGDGVAVAPLPQAPLAVVDGVPSDLATYLDDVERSALTAALGKTGGNRTAAAQLLGLTFRQLRYRLQRLGIK
jgi:two-component system response regulator PilR (NtrC family)